MNKTRAEFFYQRLKNIEQNSRVVVRYRLSSSEKENQPYIFSDALGFITFLEPSLVTIKTKQKDVTIDLKNVELIKEIPPRTLKN